MLFRSLALALFAAVAAAQSNNSTLTGLVSQLPQCATGCLSSSAQGAGCAATDFVCLCGTGRSSFITSMGFCIAQGNTCSSDDQSKLISLAGQICQKASSNPASADVASASAAVTSAVGASSTRTPNAAPTATAAVMGVMGGAAFLAAMAL